uniref:Uncharacterized protein n=1 Tax=Ciona intestinalis TaxID=7719 RepID=H2Y1F7_CIOIN
MFHLYKQFTFPLCSMAKALVSRFPQIGLTFKFFINY